MTPKSLKNLQLTYPAAEALLGGKSEQKIAPNTVLVSLDHGIGVKLYATIIVVIYPNNNYKLYSGGYQTATTRDRINALTPARVYKASGEWWLGSGDKFAEGIIIDGTGKVVK